MNTIPEIILRGNSYQRGLQHGSMLRSQVNDFLNDNKARINSIRHVPLEDAIVKDQVQRHVAIIEEQLPEIAEELKGLAEGAGITYEDAVLLQIRVELIGFNEQNILEGDCSTIGVQKSSKEVVTGQTIDLPGNMTHLGCVFRIIPENESSPGILMYGFVGLLGYLGMNTHGLSININMVMSDGWQPGVSPYLLVRHLLGLSSIEECISELKRIKISSSRSFLIGDGKKLINVECTPTEFRILEGPLLFHTNHFLHDELKEKDTIHFLFKNSSIKRLKLLQQLLPGELENLDAERLFEIFADHSLYPVGICAHAEGNIRRSETVGAVVMEPAKGTFHVRKGHVCTGLTETFKLPFLQVQV